MIGGIVRLVLTGRDAEFIGPEQREQSPHLRVFDLPTQFIHEIWLASDSRVAIR